MLGIQCLNFICLRMFIIRYTSRIQASFNSYPILHSAFENYADIKFYLYSFGAIAYFNFISTCIFLFFLINSTTTIINPLLPPTL